MLRRRLLLPLILALLAAGSAARADQTDPRLNGLFARLKAAQDRSVAQPIEDSIWAIWRETPDPETARLFASGTAAVERRAYPEAIDAFSAAAKRSPRFAEAWNQRATVYWLSGNNRASVDDIKRTLALEPRHFGALSGLGFVYLGIGDAAAAIKAFKAALALDPTLPAAKAHIEMLKDQVLGEPT